jgi:hypothetical protein
MNPVVPQGMRFNSSEIAAVSMRGGNLVIGTGAGDDKVHLHFHHDGTATLTINGDEVTLTEEEAKNLEVRLGDGDDQFTMTWDKSLGDQPPAVTVRGGDGNDDITGRWGIDDIGGGRGRDTARYTGSPFESPEYIPKPRNFEVVRGSSLPTAIPV